MFEPLLTASEVAQLLKLNVETVYALIAIKGLPAVKIGGQWRFESARVQAWVEDCYAVHEPCPDMPIPTTKAKSLSSAPRSGALGIGQEPPTCSSVANVPCLEEASPEKDTVPWPADSMPQQAK
jgi:excisionase family DNA binding protein